MLATGSNKYEYVERTMMNCDHTQANSMRVSINIHSIGIYTLIFTILSTVPVIHFRNSHLQELRYCCRHSGLKAKSGAISGIGKQRFWSLEVQRWIVADQ